MEVPDDVRLARDAALAYISEHYPEQAPAPSLTWTEEYITPEGLVGWVTYEFTSEDWVVTIGTAVVPPEMRRYEVTVENPITGFWWEGRVDAERHVTEGPEMVLTARDAALTSIIENYPDDSPSPDLTWEGGRTTPEGLIGSETFQYTSDDWMVTISYPVVAPEEVVYQIMVENPTTGFQWQGMLDAEGYLIEMLAPTGADFQPLSPATCSDLADAMAQRLGADAAVAEAPFEDYRSRKTGTSCQATASGTGLDFESFRTASEDLFWTLFQDLKAMLTAQGWQEDMMYQLDGPTGTGTGFHKERGLCLLIVGWEPSEDADCPTDQPIYACELTPEQHIYTIVLNCAEAAPTAGQPLTLEALKNAAYLSEWPADGVAQLVDGEYEEEIVPGAASKLIIVFYPDMYAFGDLDGDGVEDAAVVLATSGGGSGTFISLEAVINDRGTPNHVATASLGDRVQVNSVAIESGEITVDMVTHGPDDPLCCPTLEVTQTYRLQGDKLVELSNEG